MSATVKSAPIPPSRQREKPGQPLKWIGKSIKRVEDPRLLTGQGRYIDDIDLPNMLHAAVLRSTRAHARIKSIDVSAAAALKGVVLVLTGADIARGDRAAAVLLQSAGRAALRRSRPRPPRRRSGRGGGRREPLRRRGRARPDRGRVRRPAGGGRPGGGGERDRRRRAASRARPHQRRACSGGSRSGRWRQILPGAARIVRRRLRWPRSGAQPLETVGAVAEYESGAGKFTIHMNSSMYNYVGWTMALSLGVPAHKINLVPVIAGGSFG